MYGIVCITVCYILSYCIVHAITFYCTVRYRIFGAIKFCSRIRNCTVLVINCWHKIRYCIVCALQFAIN